MKRKPASKVTKADLIRSQRALLRAMRKLTDAFHLLRIDVQARLPPRRDER